MPGTLFKVVIKDILIFVSETWVMTTFLPSGPWGSFTNRVLCRLIGMQPRRQLDRIWVYPSLGEAMGEVGLGAVK